MAKDKYVAASAGAGVATLDGEPDKDVESTPTPEPTPAPAPEAPATEETPAPAATLDNRVELNSVPMLQWNSSEAKRVLELFEAAEKMSRALRSALHFFIGAENARGKMSQGQQLFFTAIANGTLDCESTAQMAQDAMCGQITLDNEGEVVTSSKEQ